MKRDDFIFTAVGILIVILIVVLSTVLFKPIPDVFFSPEGVISTSYIYAGSLIASKSSDTPGETQYYIQDHLGSNRKIINGVLEEQSNEFYAFGEDKLISGTSDNDYKYTGKEKDDDTGLYYYGARYYSPSIGRFIQADALRGVLADPLSLNRYAYVRNNPLKFVDPTGNLNTDSTSQSQTEEKTKIALVQVSGYNGKINTDFIESHQNLVNLLSKQGYKVITQIISSESELIQGIKDAGKIGKISSYTVLTHGTSNSLHFDSFTNSEGALDVDDVTRLKKLEGLSDNFACGATGQLGSCMSATNNQRNSKNILQAMANALGIPMTGTETGFYGFTRSGNFLTGYQPIPTPDTIYVGQDTLEILYSLNIYVFSSAGNRDLVDSIQTSLQNSGYTKTLPPFVQQNEKIKTVNPQK